MNAEVLRAICSACNIIRLQVVCIVALRKVAAHIVRQSVSAIAGEHCIGRRSEGQHRITLIYPRIVAITVAILTIRRDKIRPIGSRDTTLVIRVLESQSTYLHSRLLRNGRKNYHTSIGQCDDDHAIANLNRSKERITTCAILTIFAILAILTVLSITSVADCDR